MLKLLGMADFPTNIVFLSSTLSEDITNRMNAIYQRITKEEVRSIK